MAIITFGLLTLTIVGASFAAPPTSDNADGRILNGRTAGAIKFPFVCSIQQLFVNGEKFKAAKFCGGTIIDPSWILTAAHCFTRYPDPAASQLHIQAGSNIAYDYDDPNVQLVLISKAFIHPDWNTTTLANDIALAKLATPLKFGFSVQAGVLPQKGFEPTGLGTIVGWGAINENETQTANELMIAPIEVSDMSECVEHWGTRLNDGQICLGAKTKANACEGDSGSPFIQRANGKIAVVGLTSFGANGCQENKPTIYTKVSAFRDWIDKTKAENK